MNYNKKHKEQVSQKPKKRYPVDFGELKKILTQAMKQDAYHHDTNLTLSKYIKEDIVRPFIEFRLRAMENNEPAPTLRQVLEEVEI